MSFIKQRDKNPQMLDVALLSSRPNFPFLLLNCTD